MSHPFFLLTIVLVSISLAGCPATQKTVTLNSAVESFDKAVESAKTSLDTERKAKPRTRRYEAIEYYLLTRTLNVVEVAVIPDFTPSDEMGSFARYACAGSGSLVRESNALSYASSYSAGLKDILAPGKETLPGQFARFSALNKPIAAPKTTDKPKTGQVQSCADEIQKMISSWKPKATTDPYDENPAALIPLAIAAYQAIDAFLKTTLTTWNNYEAKVKFGKYVNQWDTDFKNVIGDDLAEARLSEAWSHRMAISMHRPFMLFKQIFKAPKDMAPDQDIERIREIGLKVNDGLAEFDALRTSPRPQDIRKGLLAAEQRLLDLANKSDTNPEEIVSFLSGLIGEFNDAKKKYDEADKAARALVTTIRQ